MSADEYAWWTRRDWANRTFGTPAGTEFGARRRGLAIWDARVGSEVITHAGRAALLFFELGRGAA
jgi:hypothetical protein